MTNNNPTPLITLPEAQAMARAAAEAMLEAAHEQLNKWGLHASAKAFLELPLPAPPAAPDAEGGA